MRVYLGYRLDDYEQWLYGDLQDKEIVALSLACPNIVSQGCMDNPGFGSDGEELAFIFDNKDRYIYYRDQLSLPAETQEYNTYNRNISYPYA